MRSAFSILLFLCLSSLCSAQLRVCNHSFEWDQVGNDNNLFRAPLCWGNCPCHYPSIGNISTVTHNIKSQTQFAQDGDLWIYLNADTNNFDNESITGSWSCTHLLEGVRYAFTFYVAPNSAQNELDSLTGRPPPLLIIKLVSNQCDTLGRTVYENFEYSLNPSTTWEPRRVNFIAYNSYSQIIFQVKHLFKDSISGAPFWHKLKTGLRIDNIGDFIPDTMYNSQATPIITNASDGRLCQGDILVLRSPYGNIPDQYWYRNDTLLGQGETINDTLYHAARYMLVVGTSDTCTRSVLIKDIMLQPNCTDLVLPNAFSPNGDGNNDTWRIVNKNYVVAQGIRVEKVRIFNRWGNAVFTSSGIDFAWHGTDYAMDVYYYYLQYRDANGKQQTIKGSVHLVR